MPAYLEIKTDEKERENRFNCHLLICDKKLHVCSFVCIWILKTLSFFCIRPFYVAKATFDRKGNLRLLVQKYFKQAQLLRVTFASQMSCSWLWKKKTSVRKNLFLPAQRARGLKNKMRAFFFYSPPWLLRLQWNFQSSRYSAYVSVKALDINQ